jgi:predicted phosphodiesterase
MSLYLIHVSDFHIRDNWEEDQGVVISSFISDIKAQVESLDINNVYVVFSGDLVLAGDNPKLYDIFLKMFGEALDEIGLTKSQRICVPGNHDISRTWVRDNKLNHDGILLQSLTEKQFNDYVDSSSFLLADKFKNYQDFEQSFTSLGIDCESLTGKGWELNNNVGVYCLNSAIFSSGDSTSDYQNLVIDTRKIHKWIEKSPAQFKVMVMHHPVSWLNDWAQKELEVILRKNFCLILSGHEHDQQIDHSNSSFADVVKCSAPALFTSKKDDLGYAIVTVEDCTGISQIKYRQWTKHQSFVSGGYFSNTDDGVVIINRNNNHEQLSIHEDGFDHDSYKRVLNDNFELSLKSYSEQPLIWVTPDVCGNCEKTDGEQEEVSFNIPKFISKPSSIVITAPTQFGLTAFSHYLCLEAWKKRSKSLWVRLDSSGIKPHEVKESISRQVAISGVEIQMLECIVVDSWENSDKNKIKLLKKIKEEYPDTPIVVLRTKNESFFAKGSTVSEIFNVDILTYHINSMSRDKIRDLVFQYNSYKNIHTDDEILLDNIISDLKVLNLHRTPLNCITLLKVSEVEFDDGPVNRTEVIKRMLFLLFNTESVAHYKRRPDLKDCEHVLGWYSEKILRSGNLEFTRDDFLVSVKGFCDRNLITIETQVLFDVLANNNILVKVGHHFRFKFTYWVMYFAAQRMHKNLEFREFIFEDKRYASYPELIEFYTGIDRNRDDALDILIDDLNQIHDSISKKMGFTDDLNLYDYACWTPTDESIEKLQNEFENEVQQSNLPDEIKDRYADRNYDPKKPYDQGVNNIVQDYLLELLTHLMKSSARALRNSDYADAEKKKELLKVIIKCWELMTKVIVILTPVLCEKGVGEFEGTRFILVGPAKDFPPLEKFTAILNYIPVNILNWFSDDLYSPKMGPLLFDHLNNNDHKIRNHYLAMILIEKKPHGWKSQIEEYITKESKNSFYLYSIESTLNKEHRLGFQSPANLEDIIYLRKMVLTKHKTGVKRPSKKLLNKVTLKDKPQS